MITPEQISFVSWRLHDPSTALAAKEPHEILSGCGIKRGYWYLLHASSPPADKQTLFRAFYQEVWALALEGKKTGYRDKRAPWAGDPGEARQAYEVIRDEVVNAADPLVAIHDIAQDLGVTPDNAAAFLTAVIDCHPAAARPAFETAVRQIWTLEEAGERSAADARDGAPTPREALAYGIVSDDLFSAAWLIGWLILIGAIVLMLPRIMGAGPSMGKWGMGLLSIAAVSMVLYFVFRVKDPDDKESLHGGIWLGIWTLVLFVAGGLAFLYSDGNTSGGVFFMRLAAAMVTAFIFAMVAGVLFLPTKVLDKEVRTSAPALSYFTRCHPMADPWVWKIEPASLRGWVVLGRILSVITAVGVLAALGLFGMNSLRASGWKPASTEPTKIPWANPSPYTTVPPFSPSEKERDLRERGFSPWALPMEQDGQPRADPDHYRENSTWELPPEPPPSPTPYPNAPVFKSRPLPY